MGEVCGVLNGTALALGVRDLALTERGVKEPAVGGRPAQGDRARFHEGVRLLSVQGSHRVRPQLP